jgi:Fe-S-cluster containining protein
MVLHYRGRSSRRGPIHRVDPSAAGDYEVLSAPGDHREREDVTMDIETDIERIRSVAGAKEEENWRFRAYLKGLDLSEVALDHLVWRHIEDIEPRIDCCACANCCSLISPLLCSRDIRRLADHLGIEKTQLIKEYLRLSKERNRYVLERTPCRFLHEKRCTVYEARPDDCRSFPHLHKREFRSRLIGVVENCSICPIVYHVFERLKMELWGR